MAQVYMIPEAAHALCDEANIAQEDRRFAYQQQTPEHEWGEVADDFIWMMDIDMPFTIAELEAKAAELLAAEPMAILRKRRNALLKESDWMAGQDRTMSEAESSYRQALRDLPQDYPDVAFVDAEGGDWTLTNVTFPTKP